jgi:hypothetical protein
MILTFKTETGENFGKGIIFMRAYLPDIITDLLHSRGTEYVDHIPHNDSLTVV